MLHGWTNLSETNRGSFPVGTPVQYTCDAGYVLDGPSIATCTASGHWSFEPPLCIRTDGETARHHPLPVHTSSPLIFHLHCSWAQTTRLELHIWFWYHHSWRKGIVTNNRVSNSKRVNITCSLSSFVWYVRLAIEQSNNAFKSDATKACLILVRSRVFCTWFRTECHHILGYRDAQTDLRSKNKSCHIFPLCSRGDFTNYLSLKAEG